MSLYPAVIISEFEQPNASLAWETIVSDNNFFPSNYGKYIVLRAGKICWAKWFYPDS